MLKLEIAVVKTLAVSQYAGYAFLAIIAIGLVYGLWLFSRMTRDMGADKILGSAASTVFLSYKRHLMIWFGLLGLALAALVAGAVAERWV